MCSNCTRQVVQFCVSYKYEVLRKKRRKCEKKRKNEEREKKKKKEKKTKVKRKGKLKKSYTQLDLKKE